MMSGRNLWRERAVHIGRCLVLVAIVLLIHVQHKRLRGHSAPEGTPPELTMVRKVFPNAARLALCNEPAGSWFVFDSDGTQLGHAMQTSPEANDIIGFSGPTNVLLGFDDDGQLAGLQILSSEDTRDHVDSVLEDKQFLSAFDGMTRKQILQTEIDAVSGATLTSVAIQQSILRRLGKAVLPGKFPQPLVVADVQPLFGTAAQIAARKNGRWDILNDAGGKLGFVLRTSPTADNIIGYQGPTDAIVGFSPAGRVVGVAVLRSFDNQPYVRYVREDYGFPAVFEDMTLPELAELDLDAAEVEGVAGATMTSMSVARALVASATHNLKPPVSETRPAGRGGWSTRDIGTSLVVVCGLVLAFTSLRGRKWVRIGFQVLLIVYLGLINGDMVSQALLVGWSRHGIPVSTSLGLAVLTVASFLVPMFAGRNVYCSHLCPHGAVQQLIRNRLPWRVRLSRRVTRGLSLVPGLLLLWVVVVAMTGWAFSLVDIEPFDAWLFRVAGLATIVVAVAGLIAAAFIPMAYCRFGCPTGALLGYARRHRGSGQITVRDGLAAACLVVAVVLFAAG